MTITAGNMPSAYDVRNLFTGHGNVLIGKTGTLYLPLDIDNATGVRNVYLWLWGKAAGSSATVANHGSMEHLHNTDGKTGTETDVGAPGFIDYQAGSEATHVHDINAAGTNLVNYVGVPKDVEIWIDGSDKTQTIGDPNSRGATMYDSVNYDWGIDGTTVWDTGKMNITAAITWTAGLHYLELKETGGIGGTLIWMVRVEGW